jgi:hypothetical protein
MKRPPQAVSPIVGFFISRIVPWPFFLMGCFLVYVGCHEIFLAGISTGWPVASGRVTASRVITGSTYSPQVNYSYEVGGKSYSSTRVSYSDYGSSEPTPAREVVDRYAPDAAVLVSYRPDAPSESVLEPGIQLRAFLLPLFGLPFALGGLALLVFGPGLVKGQPVPRGVSRIVVLMLPWPFLILGLLSLTIGCRQMLAAARSSDWPSAEGQVLSSRVKVSHGSGAHGGTSYSADIGYSYEVGQARHLASRVAYGDYGASLQGHALSIVERYPVDSHVRVFYDPEEPSESVLEPGVKLQTFLFPVLGLLFTAAGGAILWDVPRRLRSLRKSAGRDLEPKASFEGSL